MNRISRTKRVVVFLLLLFFGGSSFGVTYKIHPVAAGSEEDFEIIANTLKPGDELILYGGTYSQTARRAVTAKGSAGKPITIRAAEGQKPLLTHPADRAARRRRSSSAGPCPGRPDNPLGRRRAERPR